MMRKLLSALALLALGAALAQPVELFHDKANWNANYDKVGALGAAAGAAFKGVPYSDTSSYQAAIRTALGSNRAPGMFTWWGGYRMEDLVKANLVEDLTPLWSKYIGAGDYSRDLAKAFTVDGKIYAIPNLVAYWVVFYNKKTYADAGIRVPTTWAQLEANNARLKARNVTAFAQTVEGRWPAFIWFQEFLVRQNPDFYDRLMEGKAKYTDPQVRQVFTTWKRWMDNGWMTDPSIGFGTAGTNAMARLFAQGRVANILVGDWYSGTLQEAGLKPGDDYGMFILPNLSAGVRPSVIFEAGPILVGRNTPDKAQALKAAEFWMSTQAQKTWTDLMSFSPASRRVAPDSAMSAALIKQINDKDYRLFNRIWEATPSDIIEAAVDEFGKFMVNPATPIDQVLRNVQTIADGVWAKRR